MYAMMINNLNTFKNDKIIKYSRLSPFSIGWVHCIKICHKDDCSATGHSRFLAFECPYL